MGQPVTRAETLTNYSKDLTITSCTMWYCCNSHWMVCPHATSEMLNLTSNICIFLWQQQHPNHFASPQLATHCCKIPWCLTDNMFICIRVFFNKGTALCSLVKCVQIWNDNFTKPNMAIEVPLKCKPLYSLKQTTGVLCIYLDDALLIKYIPPITLGQNMRWVESRESPRCQSETNAATSYS